MIEIQQGSETYAFNDLREDLPTLLRQLRTAARPITLTIDGKPEAVLQSTAEYQRLLDLAAAADANEGIRQGLEQLERGEGRPASEFIAELRAKYALPG